MKRELLLCAVASLLGCSSGGATSTNPDPSPDLALAPGNDDMAVSPGGADMAQVNDMLPPPDLTPPMPSEADCFTDWKKLGNCPAPQITESYLGNNCAGTTGVFVVGRYFQSGNKFWTTNGFMPYGPYALASKLGRDTWNYLTPRIMCITTSNDATYWTGFAMQVKNPDGVTSNSVTVTNKVGTTPALPSTGSTSAFDWNACMDAPMTYTQGQAKIVPPASSATLGPVTISKRTRPCNAVSGCGDWNPTTTETTTTAGLQVVGGTSIHFMLGTTDCGAIGSGFVSTNYCSTTGPAGSYDAHVSANCMMLNRRGFSSVAGDGSYTETHWGAVIRY
ncbi:MAG TPA: hypothetical protein PKI49_01180 [Pseudomonadota bacterium]|nr:hypothetical protein [Pseudomonadota bacterium]